MLCSRRSAPHSLLRWARCCRLFLLRSSQETPARCRCLWTSCRSAQPEPQLELVDRGAGGRDGTGSEGSDAATEAATARSARRAAMPRGTTRRGGRKTSAKRSGEAWDASRVSYEIGIVLEGVVRRVEIIEVGYHGPGALDSLYWDNPFLLRSLPSMPLPCKCACCQGLPCKGSRCVGCKLCWGGCSRAFGRREGECCRVYERPGGPFLGGNSVEKLRATALRGHFGIRQVHFGGARCIQPEQSRPNAWRADGGHCTNAWGLPCLPPTPHCPGGHCDGKCGDEDCHLNDDWGGLRDDY